MDAGQLTRFCEFRRRGGGTPDGGGGLENELWLKLFDRFGHLKYERGAERVRADRVQAELAGTLTVYLDPDTAGLTEADRVDIDGVDHAITSVADVDGRRTWLEIGVVKGAA